MHQVLELLQKHLLEQHTRPEQARFVHNVRFRLQEVSIDQFVAQIDHPLPPLFVEYYRWLVEGPLPEPSDIQNANDLPRVDERWEKQEPARLLQATREWEELQAEQPDREWRKGFVEVASWNGCCVLVLDTLGAIGDAGCLLWWDFKGGSDYVIQYPSTEHYLQCQRLLLQQGLYFEPSDPKAYDEFYYGTMRDRIQQLEEEICGPARSIPW